MGRLSRSGFVFTASVLLVSLAAPAAGGAGAGAGAARQETGYYLAPILTPGFTLRRAGGRDVELQTSINDVFNRGAGELAGSITMIVDDDEFAQGDQTFPPFVPVTLDPLTGLPSGAVGGLEIGPDGRDLLSTTTVGTPGFAPGLGPTTVFTGGVPTGGFAGEILVPGQGGLLVNSFDSNVIDAFVEDKTGFLGGVPLEVPVDGNSFLQGPPLFPRGAVFPYYVQLFQAGGLPPAGAAMVLPDASVPDGYPSLIQGAGIADGDVHFPLGGVPRSDEQLNVRVFCSGGDTVIDGQILDADGNVISEFSRATRCDRTACFELADLVERSTGAAEPAALHVTARSGTILAMVTQTFPASAEARLRFGRKAAFYNAVPGFTAAQATGRRAVAFGAVSSRESRVFMGVLNLKRKRGKVKARIFDADGRKLAARTLRPEAMTSDEAAFPKRARGAGLWVEFKVRGKGKVIPYLLREDATGDVTFIKGFKLR